MKRSTLDRLLPALVSDLATGTLTTQSVGTHPHRGLGRHRRERRLDGAASLRSGPGCGNHCGPRHPGGFQSGHAPRCADGGGVGAGRPRPGARRCRSGSSNSRRPCPMPMSPPSPPRSVRATWRWSRLPAPARWRTWFSGPARSYRSQRDRPVPRHASRRAVPPQTRPARRRAYRRPPRPRACHRCRGDEPAFLVFGLAHQSDHRAASCRVGRQAALPRRAAGGDPANGGLRGCVSLRSGGG